MAKKHSGLTTSDLHHPKGILVESTASMFVMSNVCAHDVNKHSKKQQMNTVL